VPEETGSRLDLEVTYAARRPWAPTRAEFLRWAREALRGRRLPRRLPARARAKRVVLSVRVVGAAKSRTLNARYRHKDRPTNVLSFGGAGALPDGENFLGELVICAPVVAREARAQGKSARAHWAHMTVHGVLHLLGFDHERSAEAREMAAGEIQILDRLGFSNPYV
jgi:probable rRNA maturation factor